MEIILTDIYVNKQLSDNLYMSYWLNLEEEDVGLSVFLDRIINLKDKGGYGIEDNEKIYI
jgi:hypothetical protein